MRDISIPSIERQPMGIEAAPVVLVCHVVTKTVLDEMGQLLTLLDKMGLDEMG